MRLSHAEWQKRYRDRHENNPEAKKCLAVRKKALSMENAKTDSNAKKAYQRSLQKIRSQWARDKKKLGKINERRRKDGQPLITLDDITGQRGDCTVAATGTALAPALPPTPSTSPLLRRQSKRGRPDVSSEFDTTVGLAEAATTDHLIVTRKQ